MQIYKSDIDISVQQGDITGKLPKIFHVGSGVIAPKALYTPEPMYDAEAQAGNIQAVMTLSVVIDQEGKVDHVRIITPAGMGLDDKAATTVKTWRFKPGLRNGEPVAVEMEIEISLNLNLHSNSH